VPISQDYEATIGFITTVVVLTGIAVIGRTVVGEMSHHSIPSEELNKIAEKYGYWAARRSEAVCPHMDVACVEREAKRLYETQIYRR